jgi:hypothetical protein
VFLPGTVWCRGPVHSPSTSASVRRPSPSAVTEREPSHTRPAPQVLGGAKARLLGDTDASLAHARGSVSALPPFSYSLEPHRTVLIGRRPRQSGEGYAGLGKTRSYKSDTSSPYRGQTPPYLRIQYQGARRSVRRRTLHANRGLATDPSRLDALGRQDFRGPARRRGRLDTDPKYSRSTSP